MRLTNTLAEPGLGVTNGPEHEIQVFNGVTYDYINDDHLKSVSTGSTTYSMAYDALGRCVKRTLTGGPTTYYIYDGEPSEWGHREMDGQAREGNGRDERERTSQKPILEYDGGGTL